MGLFHEWSELNGDQTLVRRSSVELEGRALPQDPDFEMRQKQYEYLTCLFFVKPLLPMIRSGISTQILSQYII